jgi:hypothetical protein
MTAVFNLSVTAAASRASPTENEYGRSVLGQVVSLDSTAASTLRDDYVASPNADPVALYEGMAGALDALYQQIHVAGVP